MSKKFNIKEWQEKHLLKEHVLGDLPSDKLIKMKWNPLNEQPGEHPVAGGGDYYHKSDDIDIERDSRGQSKAEVALGIAKAAFANAIGDVDADEIWDTYKALDDVVKAYVQELDPQHPLSLA